jgi:hypothetical protein
MYSAAAAVNGTEVIDIHLTRLDRVVAQAFIRRVDREGRVGVEGSGQ